MSTVALRLILAVALATFLGWAGYTAVHAYNEHLREQGRTEVRTAWDHAKEVAQADEDRKDAERRRQTQEADDAHTQALNHAAADAAAARTAADGLRRQLAVYVAAARRSAGADRPAAASRPGVQGADPLDLLADLLSRTDLASGDLAQFADAVRAAGQLCEARYDALTPGTPR